MEGNEKKKIEADTTIQFEKKTPWQRRSMQRTHRPIQPASKTEEKRFTANGIKRRSILTLNIITI